MKYLLMGTSANVGNMFSTAWAVLFPPFLPMRNTLRALVDYALFP